MAKKITKQDLGIEQYAEVLGEIKTGLESSIDSLRNWLAVWKGADANAKSLKELAKTLTEVTTLVSTHKKVTDEQYKSELKAEKLRTEKLKRQKEEAKLNQEVIKQIKEETKAEDELNKKKITAEKIRQEKIKTSKEEFKAEQELQKAISREAKEREKAAKEAAKQAKEQAKLNSVYEQSKIRLNNISKRLIELELRGKTNTRTYKLLREEFVKVDTAVRKAENSVGRFQRDVGKYKDSIKDAIHETGVFNNTLGRLLVTLRNLKIRQDEAAKSSSSLSKILKLTGAAIAITAITLLAKGITAAIDVNRSLSEGLEKTQAKLLAFTLGGFDASEAMGKFKDALFASKDELIKLRNELQKIQLDEEDFNEISNDVTLGFIERNAALEEAIKLSEEKAKKQKEIAQKELDVLNKEVEANAAMVGLANVMPEILERQAEAQRNLNAAIDAENDLVRINSQRQRQRTQEQLIQEVELIRSKRKSSTAQVDILKEQIADEKKQLEERRLLNDQLIQANQKTFQEQIKVIEEGIQKQIDQNDLLATTDNILLAQKIKNLNLSESLTDKLGEIIKKQQDAEIEGKKNIKTLEEEEIRRKQRIAEISREINQQQIEFDIFLSQQSIDSVTGELGKVNEQLGNTPLNPVLLKRRKLLIEALKGLGEQDLINNRILLEQKAEDEKKKIEDTVFDEKIKAAEILRINEQLNIDLEKLESERFKEKKELNDELLKQDKELAQKQLDFAISSAEKLTNVISDGLSQRSDRIKEQLDREVSARETAIEKQRNLAERGLENQLAFEEKKLAEAELRRRDQEEEDRRQQEAAQLAQTYLNLLNQYIKEDPRTAPAKAFVETFGARAISRSIAGFFEGTERVSRDLGVPDMPGKDGYIIRVDGSERVLTGEQNRKIGDLSNDDLANLAHNYNNKVYLPDYAINPGLNRSTADNMANSVMLHAIVNLNKNIEDFKNIVANRPEYNYAWDTLGNLVETIKKNGQTKQTTYKRGQGI